MSTHVLRSSAPAVAALLLLSTAAGALDRMNWSPRNHEVLSRFIQDHGKGGKSYDPAQPPYAVFDWDQTSAFLDCEEALLHYQVAHLKFKLTPEQFKALLKDQINGVTALSAQFQDMKLADLNADLAADYSFLHSNSQGVRRAGGPGADPGHAPVPGFRRQDRLPVRRLLRDARHRDRLWLPLGPVPPGRPYR